MKIIKVMGREIYDATGSPTLECQIVLENEQAVRASVPHGISRGKHEAYELRDGGKRLAGYGIQKAITNLEDLIAPLLIGQEPSIIDMDNAMIELDGSENKRKLGANTILAVSMAVVRAQAVASGRELYELIAALIGAQTVTLPFPLFNVISGGSHVENNLAIQEFMVLPVGSQSFRQAMESILSFYQRLKKLLQKKNKTVLTSSEGAFAPAFDSDHEVLELLSEVIDKSADEHSYKIALDVASSQWYNSDTKLYEFQNKQLSSEELVSWYKKIIAHYPIYSIEDGLAQDDWLGWQYMMKEIGEQVQLVGDDLFATDPIRIWHGIEKKAAAAAIIKPNQIGTVTQTLQAIQLCQDYGLNTIVSHRSCETNDSFIADLAVGTSAGQIKAGAPIRGEHVAKYNRLLAIEEQLELFLLES